MARVIDAVIQLRDQFSGTLRNVNANLSQFQRQATYAGRNMVSVGRDMENVGKNLTKTITVPILAVGAGLLKLGQDFQDAQNTIRTTTGATGKDLADLDDSFKKVYGQVPTTMADASKAVADLHTQLGITGQPLVDLSAQMLNLSRITKTDLGTDITAATRMFQDAGIKQGDYAKALDYTYKVTQNTGIGIDSLQQLMTQFGGPLRQMGFDWQTSAAMLGQFQKSGVNTELVVGSLRIALGKMAKKGISDPAAALQDMITKIKEAGSSGKANALALSMFGAKAGPDMAASIREGHMDLSGLLKILKDSPDTINKAASGTMTLAQKFSVMKQQMGVAFEPVGTKLLDSLDKLMPTIKNVANTVADFAQKLANMSPQQQEMILKFALMAAAAGPVILILGKVVSGIGKVITPIMKLSKTISNAGGVMAFLATPAGIVIAVIAAVAVAALLIFKYWGPISTFFKELWADILSITKKVWATIGPTIMWAVNKIVTFWKAIWPELKQVLEFVFQTITTIVGPSLATAYIVIKAALGFIMGFWKDTWNLIKDTLKFVWDYIVGTIKIYWDLISGLIQVGLDILTGHWGAAWTHIKELVTNLWHDIGSLFSNIAIDALKWGSDFIKGLIDGIKGAVGGVVDAVKGVGNTIKSYLHFSVPDQGPLKDYMSWMPDMLQGMSQGIKINTHLVTDKVKDVAIGIKANVQQGESGSPGSTGSGRTGKGNITLNFHNYGGVRDDSDIEKIANALVLKLNETALNMG